MCFDIEQSIQLFSEQLYEKYGIYNEDYTVTTKKDYVVSHIGPYKKGGCGEIPGSEKKIILINPDMFNNEDELKTTFYHEFRHVWQRKVADKYNIGYWKCWDKKYEKIEGDYYLFSPDEIDANRFAKSNGELDGYDVYLKCEPIGNAWKELEKNKKVATEIAFNEGIHLLNSDTALRLEHLALIGNREEYNKWLELRIKNAKNTLHLTGQLHNIGVERTFL